MIVVRGLFIAAGALFCAIFSAAFGFIAAYAANDRALAVCLVIGVVGGFGMVVGLISVAARPLRRQ